MLKNRNSLASKITAVFLTVLIVFSMIPPVTINAAAAGESSVQTLVDGGIVSGNTVTFENIQLKWVEKNPSVGRSYDGWWVGVKVNAPADMTEDELRASQYINYSGKKKLFWDAKDSKEGAAVHFIQLWALVNEENLNEAIVNGTSVKFEYKFDWDADGVYEQPVVMVVNPERIILKKDDATVYPFVGQSVASVEAITSTMEISDNRSSIVTAENTAKTELKWYAAGSVRPSDGWWVGIKVNAPDALKTQEDFSKVTYQSNNGGNWSDAKSFWNNKDSSNSAEAHHIQLWGLVNEAVLEDAIKNSKTINKFWRFDWNGDGVYEQLVQMKLNPELIVLRNENDEQVYPILGTVTPLTNGTVSGSVDNISFVIDDASLTWIEADPSVGRHAAGWWVGMKVTAPASFSNDVLSKASYKKRVTSSTAASGWSDYSRVDFWSSKDSSDSSSVHTSQMWMMVTPALLDKYESLGRTIATEYIFDWDGDGSDDQKIVMEVIPGENIVLNKVEQQGFSFEESNPVDKWVGETYKNVASGGKGTGAVTYTIIEGEDVADIAQDGTLTFKKTGTVKVKAVKAEDDVYKQAVAEYTVKAIKYAQKAFAFENSNADITVNFIEKTFRNEATGGSGNGKVTYSIVFGKDVAEIDADTGVVTFLKAGQIVVVATKEADNNYLETTATYALTIETSEQDEIYFESASDEITYSKNEQSVLAVAGGSGTGEFHYSISKGNTFAEIDSKTGKITTLRAGGTITVEVYKLGDDCYEPSNIITKDITINYADQTAISFADAEPDAVVFNDNNNSFTNTASGGSGEGLITYELVNGDDIATIDVVTGEVTILAAGTIQVKATKAGDSCYNATSATYYLTIGKDTPEFEVKEEVELKYGSGDYQISVRDILAGSGKYVYSISGENEIGAAVDENGKVTFTDSDKKVGYVNVVVKKEADSQYCELEKTIKVKVSYLETDATPTLSGSKKNDSGWFTDDITITAPAGFKISYNNELSNKEWADTLIYDKEDNTGVKNVYLKSSKGITDAIAVSGLLLDKTNPSELSISYTKSDWERTLSVLTFGYYNNTKVTVTLSAKDTGSGIESFTYNYGSMKSEVKDLVVQPDGTVTYSFEVSEDYRDKVNFTVTDAAGRQTALVDNKVLVVDHTDPKLEVSYNYEGSSYEENDIIYTNNKATARFELTESNFDLSLLADADKPVVTLDGNSIYVSWTKDEVNGVWVGECNITTEGEHHLGFSYTDLSKNKTVTYNKEIRVDSTAPVIRIDYSSTAVKDNIFNPERTAVLKITERNFKPSEVELTVTATDINGDPVDLSSKDYYNYVKTAEWNSNGNEHTLELPKFDINGIYSVTVSYTDMAKNSAAEYKADEFIVDAEKPDPENITISYSDSVVDKLLEKLFKFYKEEVTVTVTARDYFSGVESLDIIYNSNNGKNNSNKPSYTAEKLNVVQDEDDKSLFTATYKIEADARGTVSTKVFDNAGNVGSAADDKVLVVDNTKPELEVFYTFTDGQYVEYNDIYYTKGATEIKFILEERNFDVSTEPLVKVNDVEQSVTWEQVAGTDKWVGIIDIEGDGDYIAGITYADESGNIMEAYTKTIHIDSAEPEINVTYSNNTALNGNNFDAAREAYVVITEHNFKAEDVDLEVEAYDITDDFVDLFSKTYSDYAKNPDNWVSEGDVHTLINLPEFDIDGRYTVTINYTDIAENDAEQYKAEFVIDKLNPEIKSVEFKTPIIEKVIDKLTFGFYKEKVDVVVTAEDITSGIDTIYCKYYKQQGASDKNADDFDSFYESKDITYSEDKKTATVTFEIPADARGYVSVVATDKAGRKDAKTYDTVINVVDKVTPKISVKYVGVSDDTQVRFYDNQNKLVNTFQDGNNAYYNGDVTARIVINEANFFEGVLADDGVIHNVGIRLTKTDNAGNKTEIEYLPEGAEQLYTGATPEYMSWTSSGDEHSFNISYDDNADYVLEIEYIDLSKNEAEISSEEGETVAQKYTSKVVTVDKIDPVIKVTYDKNDARNTNNFKVNRTATLAITEHNFRPDDAVIVVEAKDITGETINLSGKSYADCEMTGTWNHIGDTHYLVLPEFDIDGRYVVTINYNDLSTRSAETFTDEFVVDKVNPEINSIEYKTPLIEKVFSSELLEKITYGFYKSKMVVEVTAEDITSGIDFFEWEYLREEGASTVNAEYLSGKIESKNITYSEDNKTATASFEIPRNARGYVAVKVTDKAGNDYGESFETTINVVDEISPKVTVKYLPDSADTTVHYVNANKNTVGNFKDGTNAYYNGNATARIFINEANFFEGAVAEDGVIHNIGIKLTKTDNAGNVTVTEFLPEGAVQKYTEATAEYITWTSVGDEHSFEIRYEDEADYVLEIEYIDLSSNEAEFTSDEGATVYKKYKSKTVTIDKTNPVIDVTYNNNTALNDNNYKAARVATVKVTEHNFRADDTVLNITAKDITGKTVSLAAKAYENYAKNRSNWKSEGDVHTLIVPVFDIDGIYNVDLDYKDLAKRDAQGYDTSFVIDKTDPKITGITYSTPVLSKVIEKITFGYYKASVTVTVTAEDITSGVDFIDWKYNKQELTSDKNSADYEGTITAAKLAYSSDNKTATATFKIPANARGFISAKVTDKAGNFSNFTDTDDIVVVDTIAPTRVVKYSPERIFDAKTLTDVSSFGEKDNVVLYYKKAAVVTFVIDEANFYPEDVVIKVNGVERSPSDWKQSGDVWTGTVTISGDGDYIVTMSYTDRSTNKMVDYKSQKIAIDSTKPTISVEYDNNEPLNTNNYAADRTATITIVEHNFRADDVNAVITAKDIQGNDVIVADYAAYLSDRANWKSAGDVHVATIRYSTDAIYTFDISYSDIIGNDSADFKNQKFVIDHSAPTDLAFTYSESLISKVLKAVSFGFYKSKVKVTLTADDITSGVDYFEWKYTVQNGVSDKNTETLSGTIKKRNITYSNDGLTATASFEIPANARGSVFAKVVDKAGNSVSKTDGKVISVVDNIAPTVSVNYSAVNENTSVQFADAKNKTVADFESAKVAYYNGNATAEVVIDEANFFEGKTAADGVIHNVGIRLTKVYNDGTAKVTEFLPKGAEQFYPEADAQYIVWKSEGDVHSFTIDYNQNADYVLEIEYTDLSSNGAQFSANDGNSAVKTYKSKVVCIDKIAPVVSVVYGNKKPVSTIDGRDYFDAQQTAVITVEEHNFRAEDFAASITAKDILGNNIKVENYKALLSKQSSWTQEGNTYTTEITYSKDANYTFDYEYCDLALNACEDYETDKFTVDTKDPEKLQISYSKSVVDKVLNLITFGYYNSKVTVTISAQDDISGVNEFLYSYIKQDGVSKVNAELLNRKIKDANDNIRHDGKLSVTSFTIPESVLGSLNQFNGSVSFKAFDRSANVSEKLDKQVLVVDNIKPTVKVTYNDPVKQADGISYYAGNIDAQIVINEANFYKQDVTVSVTKDGSAYPVNVTWTDIDTDIHRGSFVLTEDGDYNVTIRYTDRSANEMDTYTSNQLTLDTVAPSITVSDIVANSANKDDVIGFTVVATDTNFDVDSFSPVLEATMRDEDGSYVITTVSLGSVISVEAGKTYSYVVDNLEDDAVYTLTCTATDKAGNSYTAMRLDDSAEYQNVQFSVNRNGSAFTADKTTNKLVDKYFVYSVDKDVVIEEINVDAIETYQVELNGQVLTEGQDYESSLTENSGEWSKRVYRISKALFENEGEYTIVIKSTDKAETTAYSDVKNLNVSFVVDQTAPVLTISGLKDNGRYQVNEQTVTVIPTDDGGRLDSMKVIVLDSDGEPIKSADGKDISVRFEMSGEEFLKYLAENNGVITFTIPEGLENQVQIICNDCSLNADDETNEYNTTFKKVTVSASGWIIFYANKPLFFGSVAAAVSPVLALVIFLIYKKRK